MPEMPPQPAPQLYVRAKSAAREIALGAALIAAGAEAAFAYKSHRHLPGVHLLLGGDPDYYVVLTSPPGTSESSWRMQVQSLLSQLVTVVFPGRTPVRRSVIELAMVQAPPAASPLPAPTPVAAPPSPETGGALSLNAGISGAAPLFLLSEGTLSDKPTAPAPEGMACLRVLVTAARWVSARRKSTFECLFPPSAFHPEEPLRKERLSVPQAERLLGQLQSALAAAAVKGPAAAQDPLGAAQLRSAALTVLSHLLATVRKDASFRAVADAAAAAIFDLIVQEEGHQAARPALRSHAISLLQLRAPALGEADRRRTTALLQTLLRASPPYETIGHVWRFAMCSAWDFHEGECEILIHRYGFKEPPTPPAGSPAPPAPSQKYRILEAPFKNPAGQPIYVYARTASPRDENAEMANADFVGLLINRHAQLGAFDMQASATDVKQAGYKLMMNSQCAGLTTRFAIAKMFPDADIYSSWDSTYFRTDPTSKKVTASEGIDCFMALLTGMSKSETHAQLSERMRAVQWAHEQAQHTADFCQFVGPAHSLVVSRYADVNQDGHADFYDGFLDFTLRDIKSDLENSAMPRDPGVASSQIGGDAAKGLNWAVGSLNRVTQYSDLWSGLPDASALFYIFTAGGFYSHREPPHDVPTGKDAPIGNLGCLPALCRYEVEPEEADTQRLSAEVMFHSYLAHAAWEFKRLLCAAEALRRALDLGLLPAKAGLATPLGQRGALLLTLAGLLEFPADQNFIDGLWSLALRRLGLPAISRTLVRGCITQQDHDASNYYGSQRGLRQLLGDGTARNPGDLLRADPLAYQKLASPDPLIGRALPLSLPE